MGCRGGASGHRADRRDLDEREQLGRHSDGYHVAIFGKPGDDTWAWRFEGHHISVNATIIAGQPVVAPLFLGANPAQVRHRGQVVIAPLLREEQLARAIITELPPGLQRQAIISATAPPDIVTATAAAVAGPRNGKPPSRGRAGCATAMAATTASRRHLAAERP